MKLARSLVFDSLVSVTYLSRFKECNWGEYSGKYLCLDSFPADSRVREFTLLVRARETNDKRDDEFSIDS